MRTGKRETLFTGTLQPRSRAHGRRDFAVRHTLLIIWRVRTPERQWPNGIVASLGTQPSAASNSDADMSSSKRP